MFSTITPRRLSVNSDSQSNHSGSAHGAGEVGYYVEGNLRITECLTRKNNNIKLEPTTVMSLRFTPEGLLAVGYSDGVILIYNPDTGQCLYCLTDDEIQEKRLSVSSIRFKTIPPDSKQEHKHILIASYAARFVKFWHYTSGSCLHTVREDRDSLCISLNSSELKFASAGCTPQIYIYDTETKKRVQVLEPSDSRDLMNGHRAHVFAVQYLPNHPHMLVSGGWDDTIQFWDDRQKHAIGHVYGPHICGDALDFDPTHNHIITGSWRKDQTLQIWDAEKKKKIKDVPQNNSLLYCAQWFGRDYIMCGGSSENMACIIDRGTLNVVGQIGDLPNAVYCIDGERTNSSKPKIAVGSANCALIGRIEKRQ